jgi:hypothetical protein
VTPCSSVIEAGNVGALGHLGQSYIGGPSPAIISMHNAQSMGIGPTSKLLMWDLKKEARARHADTRRVITHLRSTTLLCLCCFWTESSQEWRRVMISQKLSSHSPSAPFDGTPRSKPIDTGPPLQVCFSGLSEVHRATPSKGDNADSKPLNSVCLIFETIDSLFVVILRHRQPGWAPRP